MPIGSRAGLASAAAAFAMLAWTAWGQGAPTNSRAAAPPSPSPTVTTGPAPSSPGSAQQLICAAYCRSRMGGTPPYKVVTADSDAACCEACSSDGSCGAWVRDNRTSMCALKAEMGSKMVLSDNFTAGNSSTEMVEPNPLATGCSAADTACVVCTFGVAQVGGPVARSEPGSFPCESTPGEVIRGPGVNGDGQQTRNARACCDLCLRNERCFYWSRRRNGLCFLRSNFTGSESNDDFVSGSLW